MQGPAGPRRFHLPRTAASRRALACGLALLAALPALASAVGAAPVADDGASAQPLPNASDLTALDAAFLQDALAVAAAHEAGKLDDVDAAVAQALLATRRQAALEGQELPVMAPMAAHATPSEAAFALAAYYGAPVDETQAAQLRALDALPAHQAAALRDVLDAFLDFQTVTAAVFAEVDPAILETPALGATIDYVPILAARNNLLLTSVRLGDAFPAPAPTMAAAAACGEVFVPPALAIDTVGCATSHGQWIAFLVDVGGNDIYTAANGGTAYGCGTGITSVLGFGVGIPALAGGLVDLAGDDRYSTRACDSLGNDPHGVNGGASLGAGFLFDRLGHDSYSATTAGGINGYAGAANGGSYQGLGFLLDPSGDDGYHGGWSSNGAAGYLGRGLLIDAAGFDSYTQGRYFHTPANGGSEDGGVGILLDAAGNDNYNAPGTWGSVNGGTRFANYPGVAALLADLGGSDTFYDPTYSCSNAVKVTCTKVPKGLSGILYDAFPVDGNVITHATGIVNDGINQVVANAWVYAGFALNTAVYYANYVSGIEQGLYHTASSTVNTTAPFVISTVEGGVGTVLGLAEMGLGIAIGLVNTYGAAAQDPDADGISTASEAIGKSDPASASSRPWTDDDGDGVANQDERSRAHAMTAALDNADVHASGWSDRATFHFGHAGARASIRSPEGDLMTIVYAPMGVGSGCPPPLSISLPELAGCTLPVVASYSLSGGFLGARRAYEPGVGVPASSFIVLCTPRAGSTRVCLDNVGADGTWQITPATQSPRASTQPKTPAGFELSILGKAFNDVAPDSGDINGAGTGQNTRDPLMGVRSWNWHAQGYGTYYACSGGLVAPCSTEGPAEENVEGTKQYI